MFKVRVPDAIIAHCKRQIELYDFGQRYTANGTKEQQLTGIIGQSVIMNMFGLPLVDGATGFDNGVDIVHNGKSIDVKTMGRTTDVRDYYVNNFIALQQNLNTDVFIFCSYNKTNQELTVCGWIPKAEFLKKAAFFPKGSIRYRANGTSFQTFTDLYEIRNDMLYDVDSTEMLIKRIEMWCQNK